MLIVAIILPLTIITSFNTYNMTKQLNSSFEVNVNSNINRISDILDGINNNSRESIDMLSQDPNVLNILKSADSEQWLLKSLNSFLVTHKEAVNVYYGVSNGKMLLQPTQKLPEGYDPRQRDWYKKAVEANGDVILTDPYEDAVNKGMYIITFAKAVKDSSTGSVIGVVAIDMKLETVSNTVSNVKIGNEGYVAILDKSGKIIAHKDNSQLGKGSNDEQWVKDILAANGNSIKHTIGGKSFISYIMQNKATGYKIIGFVPEKEISQKIASSTQMSVAIAVVSLIAAVIGGVLFSNMLTRPINSLVNVLDKVRKGDFSETIVKDKRISREIEVITDSVNNMISDIVTMLTQVLDTSMMIKQASEDLLAITEESNSVGEEVSRAVQQISEGASEQAADLEDSSAIVDKLGEEVSDVMRNSESMIKASVNVNDSTDKGIHIIGSLKETFEQATAANRELSKNVEILAENSNKISTITDTIKGITEQTNLLALNASIEAARAGEAGRGFAVVADEVRKLAEQSALSASEINTVITEMKDSVKKVLDKIHYSKELNEITEGNVGMTEKSFKDIEEAAKLLNSNIKDVSSSLEQINNNKSIVISKISEIAAVAQETAATTEEVSASSEEQAAGLHEVLNSAERLSMYSETLDELVNKFKINKE